MISIKRLEKLVFNKQLAMIVSSEMTKLEDLFSKNTITSGGINAASRQTSKRRL